MQLLPLSLPSSSSGRVFRVRRGLAVALLAFAAVPAMAQVLLTPGQVYEQDFDALPSSGGTNAWVNNVTVPGWYGVRVYPAASEDVPFVPTHAVVNIPAGNGTTNAGAFFSFGSTGSSDRALGSVGSNNQNNTGHMGWGVRLKNASETETVTSLLIEYTGEQWRDGGAVGGSTAQTVHFSYLLGEADGSPLGALADFSEQVGQGVAALDFTSPNVGFSTSTGTGLDGNAAGNFTGLSAEVAVTLLPGQEILLRWKDLNHVGNDHGLGIDDVRITARADQTPPAVPSVRITEFLYNGRGTGDEGEFIEFTNIGTEPVDITGWSFDDDSNTPGVTALDTAGTVLAPGESLILTEVNAEAFRVAWGLCDAVKIVGNNAANIGRADTINLYDAQGQEVDSLRYGDQGEFSGAIRARYFSAWTQSANLGSGDFFQWKYINSPEAVAAGAVSWRSSWGVQSDGANPGQFLEDTGSPGYSTQGELFFDACPQETAQPVVRITEFMHGGPNGEFIEFTNVGTADADLTGWSFDDDSRAPGTVSLSAFGTLKPGESAILTETAAAAFRNAWGLCDAVKVIGSNGTNLGGGGDEINLYDAGSLLVDRLTYGSGFLAGFSRWGDAADLGENRNENWHQSIVDDAAGSVASGGGAIGSPGYSHQGQVGFNPCETNPQAPTITVDQSATSPYLDLNLAISGAASGVIGDPTDPASSDGIVFDIADEDTAFDTLQISVSASNPLVVTPELDLYILRSSGKVVLYLHPRDVGYSTVTVAVTDPQDNRATYAIAYAASAASENPDDTRFHTGASDASSVIAVDEDWMFVADDEDQKLRLYNRHHSGLHGYERDVSADLGVSSGSEVDIEGSTRIGDRLYWIGAHGNQANPPFAARPDRRRIFATDLAGDEGELAELAFAGRYDHLRDDLLTWDAANGNALGLAASAAPGISPEVPQGFNIEGLTIAPNGSSAYVGFRAPLLPVNGEGARTLALIVEVEGFDALVAGGSNGASQAAGSTSFGAPILLDLGGRAIRSIERNQDGLYLILAGPSGSVGAAPNDFRLFAWDGNAGSQPELLDADLAALQAGGAFEGIVQVPVGDGTQPVQVLLDNGSTVFYGDGVDAKDLPERRHAKFRTELIDVSLPGQSGPDIFSDGFEDAGDAGN